MAASSASMAASKLLNIRNPALQSLIHRQLLHPASSASSDAATSPTLPDAQSLNLFNLEEDSTTDLPNHYSSNAIDLNFHVSNLPLNLQWPFGFSAVQIEAARTYVPKEDDYQDFYKDDDDDDEDDGNIQDYSGSDFDDEDDDGYDFVDKDSDACPRSRSCSSSKLLSQ